MAKKTKDSNLSIEERLEQALIPNWDEPYKLPENWCWTKIGAITDLYRGVSYKKHEGHSEKGVNDCLVMRGGNIKEGEIDIDADNVYVDKKLVSKEQYVKKHDVVIVSSTGSTKVIGRAGISFADYNDVAFGAFLTLVRPIESVHKPYVSYYFQGDMYRNRMRQLASGVNINNIRNEYITDTPIPLPPLDEQKRIVSHIETLFAKLDEAKEKAQNVVDGFETRKAAILHKAFSGELTAKWRTERCVLQGYYEKIPLGELTEITSSKRIYKEEYVQTGIPFFRSSEVVELHDCGTTIPEYFISRQRYEEIKSQYGVPCEGDLLVTSVGTIGKTWIVDGREFYYKDGNLTQVKKCDVLNMKYLQYFIKSEDFKQQIKDAVAGSAYNALTIVKFKKLLIPVTVVEEQIEIVNALDSLLSKEQQTKETAEAVIEQIDTMKKAILARAFRGELGTNDPSEESAVELLKRVLEAK